MSQTLRALSCHVVKLAVDEPSDSTDYTGKSRSRHKFTFLPRSVMSTIITR